MLWNLRASQHYLLWINQNDLGFKHNVNKPLLKYTVFTPSLNYVCKYILWHAHFYNLKIFIGRNLREVTIPDALYLNTMGGLLVDIDG